MIFVRGLRNFHASSTLNQTTTPGNYASCNQEGLRNVARLALLANRVREYKLIYEELDRYLSKLTIPYLGCLREAQNYVRAYARGMGVLEQWEPIGEWLRSKRSRP